jgi:predicted Zn-dependent protease
MRTCAALLLLLFGPNCLAQAYPEREAAAAWRALAAGYVRQALKAQALDWDQALNARVDAVMATVGAAVSAVDPRFADTTWRVILIEDFGHGAAAFPGQIVLMDAKFVRQLQLGDDELALILAHEAAHVLAGHAMEKLSFMAEIIGREKVPTASMALHEFLAQDAYAAAFQPKARLQEREADRLGAAIFFATGYDAQRGLQLFDKLAQLERGDAGTHDPVETRRQSIAQVIADLKRLHAAREPVER